MSNGPDRALEAFRRLLADGHAGGQSKVDALVALSQRTVLIPTWGPGDTGFRTLVNSAGDAALPIFTSADQLEAAAAHFGWRQPEGSVPHTEAGARQALRHAVAHEIPFVVVDITAPHALEVERSEIEPLLTPNASRGSGPFAAVGRVTSSMLEAVKPTPPPSSAPPDADALPEVPGSPGVPREHARSRTPAQAAPSPQGRDPGITAGAHVPPSPASASSATFGSGTSVTIVPLQQRPSDELLDALAEMLRGYPEVEWAAFCAASRGPAQAVPTVGLRVDTSFRQRVGEIIGLVRQTGEAEGASLDVLLLDSPEVMRAARESLVFYPWRR